MNKMEKNYIDIKNTLQKISSFSKEKLNSLLNESEETNDAVPYTKEDQLMSSILDTAKVQLGADFSKFKNPMLYYPKDNNVTLSGEIPSLNELRFQFKLIDQEGGCYLWGNPLLLNKDNLVKLNRLFGIYENWKNELITAEDIKPMSLKNN